MKLVILDPGYDHPNAHHQTVNLGVARELAARGAETQIMASANIQSEALLACEARGVTALPYFATPCYPPQADRLPRHQFDVLAQNVATEVVNLYRKGYLDGSEHLLWHTGFSFHYAGLAQALWQVGDRLRGRLLISPMFHPGARPGGPPEGLDFLDAREYLRHKQALELLQAAAGRVGCEVLLAAPCRDYAAVYQTMWSSGPVEVHPAVCFSPLAPAAPEAAEPQVLLYLGGPKRDKGLEYAAALGARAALALPGVRFVFHFNDAFPEANVFEPAVAALRQAGARHGNVSIITGNLAPDRYDALIAASRVACLLYDPRYYRFKTSGVFWDALRPPRLGWLVTADTWADTELTRLGLPHAVVPYGDLDQGVERLAELTRAEPPGHAAPGVDAAYLELLNSPFGAWVHRRLAGSEAGPQAGRASLDNPDYRPDRGRLLIVRTNYGHFSPLSGPGGFIPHLRGLGYAVDEWLVPLGDQDLEAVPKELRDPLIWPAREHLRSYQGNAVAVESRLQQAGHHYDLVHFEDAEHCGLLSALLRLRVPDDDGPRLVATYHQPAAIMRDLVGKPGYLRGFDAIQLMSPCQAAFFAPLVAEGRLHVVPHGLAPELLEEHLPAELLGLEPGETIPGLEAQVRGKTVLLTVGNWLRDYPALLETAARLRADPEFVCVIVSKGLSLDTAGAQNVLLFNAGLTDCQLHGLYKRADLLFLPLVDGAANNAILEAMAHGLPIVTTDLPSTRFYTKDQAVFAGDPDGYAAAVRRLAGELREPGRRAALGKALRARAEELTWRNVARLLHQNLYAPLLAAGKGPRP